MAKVGLSTKFCVAVFKASILDSLWGPLAKVGLSANLGVLVFKASLLSYPGGPSAKVGSSANLGVVVFKASLLYYLGVHLPKCVHLPSFVYCYSRHLCSITKWGPSARVGLSAKFGVVVFKASILQFTGGSICQSMFICKVWCSSIQGIYSQFTRGPSARVGSSAKFGVAVFKAFILDFLGGGSIGQSRFICQFRCTGIQGISALLLRGVYWLKKVCLPSLV